MSKHRQQGYTSTCISGFTVEHQLHFYNIDGAMHFIYAHKYNTNSTEDSSHMNWILSRA